MSSLIGILFYLEVYSSLGHSYNLVLHYLQTIPPIFSRNSSPSITSLSGSYVVVIPLLIAIARAVSILSLVIILSLIPASVNSFIT